MTISKGCASFALVCMTILFFAASSNSHAGVEETLDDLEDEHVPEPVQALAA